MPSNQKLGLQTNVGVGADALAARLALIREAEDLGYSSLWIAEVSGPDAFVSLGALAVNTRKAELATGVIPMQIRTPGVMAMGFLTINELSGGRAIAGLGVSSPIIVERWHGASYRKPVTAMRECVTIMRQLFTEGRSKFQGEVYKSDFKLSMRITAPHPPKIYLAGLNAPMLRLAGEVADGVLMNYSPPEAIPEMVQHIAEGAKAAGRDPSAIDVGIYIRMCITEDEAKAVDSFRRRAGRLCVRRQLQQDVCALRTRRGVRRGAPAVEGRQARGGSQSLLGSVVPQDRSVRECNSRTGFRRALPRRRRHASRGLSDRPRRNIVARLSQHDARARGSLSASGLCSWVCVSP
jgi:alkanesulfonate monooxygenase SsuD/methylene tetrahydromethanopterin reductase-like flavin-dependent oxidoreductase (luciferase family)